MCGNVYGVWWLILDCLELPALHCMLAGYLCRVSCVSPSVSKSVRRHLFHRGDRWPRFTTSYRNRLHVSHFYESKLKLCKGLHAHMHTYTYCGNNTITVVLCVTQQPWECETRERPNSGCKVPLKWADFYATSAFCLHTHSSRPPVSVSPFSLLHRQTHTCSDTHIHTQSHTSSQPFAPHSHPQILPSSALPAQRQTGAARQPVKGVEGRSSRVRERHRKREGGGWKSEGRAKQRERCSPYAEEA